RFAHFSVIHELEAWLLSDISVFPREIRATLEKLPSPERVNFDAPPSVVLERAYSKHLRRDYKKVVDGRILFPKLNVALVLAKCPSFAAIVDWMMNKAKAARGGGAR